MGAKNEKIQPEIRLKTLSEKKQRTGPRCDAI